MHNTAWPLTSCCVWANPNKTFRWRMKGWTDPNKCNIPISLIYWGSNKLIMNISQSFQYFYFFIIIANTFTLAFCEYRFITTMFISACVNTITETLHHAWSKLILWNVFFVSLYLVPYNKTSTFNHFFWSACHILLYLDCICL